MNKRQRKKNRKKQEAFNASFASSYREMKEHDRMYHEFVVADRRSRKREECDIDSEWFFDELTK